VKRLVAAVLLMMMAGCGSTYTLKKGGWVIKKDEKKGTCLTVYGDSDPEVVVVCILAAEPIKLPKSVLEAACPKPPACPDCPTPVVGPAEEKTDGAG